MAALNHPHSRRAAAFLPRDTGESIRFADGRAACFTGECHGSRTARTTGTIRLAIRPSFMIAKI
jgi:hypothetical protein